MSDPVDGLVIHEAPARRLSLKVTNKLDYKLADLLSNASTLSGRIKYC